ncbi:MAG: anthranilate phosphoribosyltransferase, partial [Pseudomonadota bacterium]
KGGDPVENAKALKDVLTGAKNAYRDIACLNAAAGLVVAGLAEDLGAGITQAQTAIDDGSAKAALNRLVEVSNG